MEKLREGLSVIEPGDTTVLLGDLSWALGIEQAEKDFAFLHEIPGRKIILKGNHDYWWTTATKFIISARAGWDDMFILNNNCYFTARQRSAAPAAGSTSRSRRARTMKKSSAASLGGWRQA